MSEKKDSPVNWLHSPSARSKRKAIVAKGCFMLEHDATGRFYLGVSDKVSDTVDKQLSQLALGKHPCKLLNELYARDSIIRVYEYPVKAEKARKALLKAVLDEASAPYLCLNPKEIKVK